MRALLKTRLILRALLFLLLIREAMILLLRRVDELEAAGAEIWSRASIM
jgi:hypothetical protein